MRILLIVILYNILNVILAQVDTINQELGDVHFHAAVGNLPLKYLPLSEQDQKASDKAADLIDFIQLVPKIDPLNIPVVQTPYFDAPFLFFRGTIELENLVLAGFKQLQLHGLELRLNNLRSDLNITIPHMYFEADVHLKSFFIKFHLSANLFDVCIAVTSGGFKTQAPTGGEVLQLDSAAVKVDIRDVVINTTNKVVNEELMEEYQDYYYEDGYDKLLFSGSGNASAVLNGFLETALDIANKALFKVSIDFLKDYLLSDTY